MIMPDDWSIAVMGLCCVDANCSCDPSDESIILDEDVHTCTLEKLSTLIAEHIARYRRD